MKNKVIKAETAAVEAGEATAAVGGSSESRVSSKGGGETRQQSRRRDDRPRASVGVAADGKTADSRRWSREQSVEQSSTWSREE